ncbi:hypothetical protein SELMODRAFT_428345 [Selaginella moellendorffii]|uniref:DHHA1 domain-containing protein n=1 Tax=Selaginella moellendorffii TaxID=88036 RepID=D8T2J3_SELML|nr:uncharacterized protein LOC9629303 isoform X2 [Selaginella moellendorffii]EFJ09107.1 hypothetical protein SELMODRAFT_428345 [Selaginella moellendorffii]|eukprot:XP_002989840.1 uncharacterized protein LOC9629303 isoform X2 [Selaginella moellendorffii]
MRLPAAILYHYPCTDGVFAALAAHLYHQAIGKAARFFPNAVYRPLRVDELPVEEVDVFYLLDFVGPAGFVTDLCSKAKEVVVLDHHKTALHKLHSEDRAPQNLHSVVDMNRSGATIAYDYFSERFPELWSGEHKLQKMYKYVEDGDLWRWSIPESKAFSSGIQDLKLEYNAVLNPSIFNQLLELDIDSVLERGKQRVLVHQEIIRSILENSFEIEIGNGKFGRFLGVRADNAQELRSDLGHQLAEKSLRAGLRPIGAVVYEVEELGDPDTLKVSLRSIDDDTTGISQSYGGGGHRCASSFMINKAELEQWI